MSRIFPLVLGLLLFSAATAFGQSRNRAGRDLPEIGSTLPEVTLYDDAGNKFSTERLAGQLFGARLRLLDVAAFPAKGPQFGDHRA